MATVSKYHTFVKYTGVSALNIAGLPWLPDQVQRVWSPSATGSSMTSAGYNPLGVWGGTLTQLVPNEKYWIHAKALGWELPVFFDWEADTNTPSGSNAEFLNMVDEHGKLKAQFLKNITFTQMRNLGTENDQELEMPFKTVGGQSILRQIGADGNPTGETNIPLPAASRTYTFLLGIAGAVTTGANKARMVIEKNGTISKAFISAKVGPVGADLITDINLGGSTIWSTQTNRLKLTADTVTGSTTTFNTTAVVEGQLVTIDVDQVGSTVAGEEITVQLVVTY